MKSIQEFIPERKILLNPGPATTSDAVKLAMIVSDICPREEEFCALMNSIKQDLVKVVDGESHYKAVMFTSSGTGGVEAAITSLVPEGKKILIIENGAYGKRMYDIASTYKIPALLHKISYTSIPDISEIRKILRANREIGIIGIVDHETTTGIRNPIQAIADMAHEEGVELIVDCMSSYAGLEIDLLKWNVAAIVSSSNKCIQGMPGLSFVIVRDDILEASKSVKRSFYHDIYSQYSGFNSNGQMQFTPPVHVVYALRKALDLFFKETASKRIERYRKNFATLKSGLENMGFKFLVAPELQSDILIAVLEPTNDSYSFATLHDFLYARGYTIYPGKLNESNTFRLSVIGDLHESDIKSFLTELKNCFIENGWGDIK